MIFISMQLIGINLSAGIKLLVVYYKKKYLNGFLMAFSYVSNYILKIDYMHRIIKVSV